MQRRNMDSDMVKCLKMFKELDKKGNNLSDRIEESSGDIIAIILFGSIFYTFAKLFF